MYFRGHNYKASRCFMIQLTHHSSYSFCDPFVATNDQNQKPTLFSEKVLYNNSDNVTIWYDLLRPKYRYKAKRRNISEDKYNASFGVHKRKNRIQSNKRYVQERASENTLSHPNEPIKRRQLGPQNDSSLPPSGSLTHLGTNNKMVDK
jgi:hypothetical protein